MNSMNNKLKPFTFESRNVQRTHFSFDGIDEVIVKDPNGLINDKVFYIQGTISGCGLGIIKNTSTFFFTTKEQGEAMGRAIIQYVSNTRVGNHAKGCVLATLGKTDKVKDQFLLDMGFIKINTF